MPARFDRTWSEGNSPRPASPSQRAATARNHRLWVLAGWLVLVFLLGGGSRDDIQSLMILRPLSVLVLAYALWGLNRDLLTAHRFPLGLAAAWAALHLLQLIPLPPQIWQTLPGREIVAEIDQSNGLDIWRPLTLVPHGTRNAAWALVAPLAVLLLGIQLPPHERRKLLPLVLGLGLLSALIGGLQLAADSESAIYFYHITNHGSPVGLFANRNHQAIFLALLPPALLVWAELRNDGRQAGIRPGWTYWAWLAGGTFLVIPLILVTGSRAGLVIASLCLLALPAILSGLPHGAPAIGRARRLPWAVLALLAIAGLTLLTIFLGRGLAFDRLLESDGSDLRFVALDALLAMTGLYWPWGTGFGSFAEVYQLHEPRELLAPAYLNHAHNDWLELVLTGGWPAVVIVSIAAAGLLVRLAILVRGADEDRGEILLGRLGLLILLMLALASLGDYPLRTPALACLAALAALWASPSRPPRTPRSLNVSTEGN